MKNLSASTTQSVLHKLITLILLFMVVAGAIGSPGQVAYARESQRISPSENNSIGIENSSAPPQPALDADCVTPPNEIVAENCLPGNPPSEWDVSGAGDANIQGFATDISVNQGGTVRFKIDTNASAYHIDIYRMGYYAGNGARKIATIAPSAVLPQIQPACLFNGTDNINLVDCGNWAESASWVVPGTATSGIYIAKLVRDDATPGASHITFIVRDDDGNSDLLFQTSDTTWQAYNGYGGYSLYAAPNHAYKVSYNRPFLTRSNSTEDFWFNSEYPMIRWLERNGYDVSYFTDVDSHRFGSEILEHNIFLSIGHDEYWSAEQRAAVEAARDAGVHLAFFSGNSVYWKTRWENSIDGTNTSFRTLVSYKEGSLAGSEHYSCQGNNNCDPDPNTWTGLWRDGCSVAGHDGCNPENSLMGTISWMGNTATIQVPDDFGPLRFWRNTPIASLPPATIANLESNTLGYEWDHEQPLYEDNYPDGRFWLSTTNSNGQTHHLSMYRAPSGALVFGAGTVQWMWGLDGNHDRGATTEDVDMQQATVNLFADMGVQPGALQNNLTAASASTDSTNPTATITSPISGANAPSGSPLIISGTAADSGGGVVGAVEISLDNGTNWIMATGRETWTYTWVPTTPGSTVNIRVRAVDDSGNIGAASAPLLVNVTERVCPCSIWNDTFTPIGSGNDGQAIEVGVKFQSTEAGYITGLRFYKDVANTGTHIGHLWASDGTQLAEAVFTSETASGWQEVYFSTPVQITANTTYVASYHSANGGYSSDVNYLVTGFDSAPLRALANGEDGPNGVYNYGPSSFPTQTYQSSNYWVDVIFDSTPQIYSVWEQGTITGNASVNDPTAIEAGFKFKSDVPGSIIGITFYKGAANTGPFIGHLWASNGTQLGAKNYTNNTADVGWQEILFDTPVHIDANTTYIGSYFTQSGNYAAANNYFTSEVYNAPLRALSNADPDGPNGVYNYGSSAFPQSSFQASNYWVDVLFAPDTPIDNTAPTITTVAPLNGATNVGTGTSITATFSEGMDVLTITNSTVELRDASNNLVPATVSYNAGTRTATLNPSSALTLSATYTARVIGGASGVTDIAGNPLASNYTWTLSTQGPPPNEGPGGPILVLSSAANPFSRYYAEILRAEGLNEFTATDISNLTGALLNNYQVVILGEITLTPTEVGLITNWVNNGGNLIAMKPDPQLASLLGITPASTTLSEGYILVNTASAPGTGIVNQTIQFHGTADRYTLSGATSIATLYSNATTATTNPAVTIVSVGSNGGQAAAFTYDLARSVVYTRQGNPAWAGQSRDGQAGPIRSDNLFYPDWVDFNKVQIPQADEQQRLLANMIFSMNADNNPLPRFWYFPRGEKAVFVMTHDEHGGGDLVNRLNAYNSLSPVGCNVNDWECVRSSTYLYTNAPITNAQLAAYQAQGYEFAVHINTGCANFTPASLANDYAAQIPALLAQFPSINPQTTQRTHCIAFSDWSTQPKVQLDNGMRLDTNYYYWPASWIQDRPGLFTGSGMPMRFADLDGTLIDVYQATTQFTDESGQTFPYNIDVLLDNAIGAPGYYGAFTSNMHTDGGASANTAALAMVASAQARSVPVISAKQLLTWLDGRNLSAFSGITWNGNALDFHVSVGGGANGLYALLPTQSNAGPLQSITRNGTPVTYTTETIKGIEYAVFPSNPGGDFQAIYSLDTTGPVISNIVATVNPDGTVTITWDTDEASDSRVDFGTDSAALNLNSTDAVLTTTHSITLTGLIPNTTHYFRVTSADASANSSTSPVPPATLNFTTPSGTLGDTILGDFNSGDLSCAYPTQTGNGELILPPTIAAEFDGFVLPSGWSSNAWTGGTPSVSGGLLTLNGVSARNDTLLNPGTSLEFVATFTGQSFQHVGFGGGDPTFNNSPWIMFSTSNDGSQLYTRILANAGGPFNVGDDKIALGAQYIGSPHHYRIDWNANSVNFYIDGVNVLSRTVTINTQMRAAASDYDFNNPALTVDWMHVSPYISPCTFTSRVFDAGQPVNWETMAWTGQTPAGTSFAFSYRIGNTPTPDGTWTSFQSVPTSGSALSGNSRYIQYQVVLAASNNTFTPVLEDVSITYSIGADVTSPTIIGRVPAPNAVDVDETGNITVTFSEPMDPATIIPANFSLTLDGPNTPVPFTLSYSGVTATLNPNSNLALGTQYAVHVESAVADLAGNPLGADSDWSFITKADGLLDTTGSDFGSGTNACYITETTNGELILNPTVGTEFSGASLPAGWVSAPWTGGTSTVGGGQVVVDGAAAYYSTTTFTPGRSFEFVATFTASQFQHVGLIGAPDFGGSWAIFSTNNTTNQFYARTSDGQNTPIPGTWIGTPHRYRIDWTGTTVSFYIDGIFYAQHNVALADMRPAISDYDAGGTAAIVDWMRLTPYGTPCAFESRIFDAGSVVDWLDLISVSSIPAGTNAAFETRTGNTPTPDGTWSAWQATSGVIASPNGQYAQYRVTLGTADVNITPAIESVELTYLQIVNHAPTTSGIANVAVDEDASNSTLDLWTSFSDLDEPDSALTYTIQTNTNAALFTSVDILANQNLVLDYAENQAGTADITVRATDSGGLFVETTFTVTVNPVNDEPTTTGISNVTVDEDAANTTIDLWPSFADIEDADSALVYTVANNTNPALFTSHNINAGQNLVLDFAPDASGSAQITVRATDTGGLFIETVFTVNITEINDAPTTTGIANVTVNEDAADTTIDLWPSFADVENTDAQMTYTITGNTNPALFTSVSIAGGQNLVLDYAPDQFGSAQLTVRATDASGLFIETTFTVTVNPVNDVPVTSGIANVTVDEDAPNTTIDLWASFADVEDADSALTYSITGNTNAALFTSLSVTGNQNLVLDYASNANGSAQITIRATDTGTLFVETTFTVTVNPINDPPAFTSTPITNATEDSAYTYNITTSDPDGDTLIITAPTLPAWLSLVDNGNGTASLSGTPLNAHVGIHNVTLRVNDGVTDVDQIFTITVTNTNDAPIFTSTPITTAAEDALYIYNITASDPDLGAVLTITAPTLPAWLTFTDNGNGTATLSGTPVNANVGIHNVTLNVSDGIANVNQVFAIDVGNTNDAPFFTSAGITAATEDVSYIYNISTSDPDLGSVLTITAPTLPAWLSLVDNGDGTATLSGTPSNANVGANNVTLRVSDGILNVDQNFVITVANVNDAPAFTSTSVTAATEDILYTYNITASDPDLGTVLAITAPTLPSWLSLVDNGNGTATLSGVPLNANVGNNPVVLQVSDGTVSVQQNFTIAVANVNDAPTFTSTALTSATEATLYTYDITTNDPDVGDSLIITAPTLPAWLSLVDNGNGTATLSGTPTNANVGNHNVTLRVSDGTASADQIFVVTVANVNDAPAFTSTAVTSATEDVLYTYNITASDPDLGDTLTITAPTLPAWLSLVDNGNGTAALSGTPTNAHIGNHNVTLRVTDGTVNVEQPFTIVVANVNDSPTDIALSNSIVNEGLPAGTVVGTLSTTDPDSGDTFTYSFCGGPDDASFQLNGDTLETAAVLDADIQGTLTICIHSEDAGGLFMEEQFIITISNVNDAPVITLQSNSKNVDESSPLFFNTANASRITLSDPDAGTDAVQTTLTVIQGRLTLSTTSGLIFSTGDGTTDNTMTFSGALSDINAALNGMRYDPPVGFNGGDTLQIDVDDLGNNGSGGNLTDSASMDLSILPMPPKVVANGINTVADTGDGILAEAEVVTASITQFIVTFDQDLNDPAGNTALDDVTNPANFMLVHDNADDFQTVSCAGGVSSQDIAITINSVTYSNNGGAGPFIATVNVNDGLPLAYGNYRLFICGTTSITDLYGLELAGDGNTAGTDMVRTFTIPNGIGGGGSGGAANTGFELPASGVLIPVTGFAPGEITPLPAQTGNLLYETKENLRLEIPSLSINQPIVGIKYNNGWDVTWLESKIGYLEGSAYPTWAGNTILTGHATDPNGNLTSFAYIKDLKIGDKFRIHANGQIYIYQVQQNRLISPASLSALFKHEEYDWVTLVTCENWNSELRKFTSRRLVRAVLVSVIPEK